ncbi:MAG: hypothetical protein ACR2MG_15280 [Pyrinomonadaceae bacterium]
MPDERDIAQDKKVLEQNAEKGETAELEGKHPEHAPQPGRKTPQEDLIDEDAIDESGNLIHDDGKDENDAK